MRTYDVYVDNTDERIEEVLETVDQFIDENGIMPPKSYHLRLLVEEMLRMVRSMTGDYNAVFWLAEEKDEYRLRLTAKTRMDLDKKNNLISASTTGKNASARGLMGKVEEIIENGRLNAAGVAGVRVPDKKHSDEDTVYWTLQDYRKAVGEEPAVNDEDDSEKVVDSFEGIEKSIVEKMATNVIVGIKKDEIDMTITLDME